MNSTLDMADPHFVFFFDTVAQFFSKHFIETYHYNLENLKVPMRKLILAIIALSFLSCNKNSLQLPYQASPIILRDTTCFYGNSGIVRIEFRQDADFRNNAQKTINVRVVNLTRQELSNCRIFIEMCTGDPYFNNCQNEYEYTISLLKPEEPDSITLPFNNIELDAAKILAGVVSTQDKHTILSDVYDGDFVKYVDSGNVQYSTGLLKGVVFADGESFFMLSLGVNTNYNIKGKFSDTSSFNNGRFLQYSDITKQLDSATVVTLEAPANKTGFFNYSYNKNVKFGLKLASPQSIPGIPATADSIILSLTKK